MANEMALMKTLTLEGTTYEVVDAHARALLGTPADKNTGVEASGLHAKISKVEEDIKKLDADVVKEISVNGVLVDIANGHADIQIQATGSGVVSGEEVIVNEDNTLSVVKVGISKIVSESDTTLVLSGGNATLK